MGNSDGEVIATRHGDQNDKLPLFALGILRWRGRQLVPERATYLTNGITHNRLIINSTIREQ